MPETPPAIRSLVEQETFGVLSTAHADHDGWPFASVVPYALTADGDPVVMLSNIAEHTRNIDRDPRVTLLVRENTSGDAVQASSRVAIMATARKSGDPAVEKAYFDRFPSARRMLSAHGFFLYVLEVARIRWIAGFGSMGWLERGDWAPADAPDPLAAHAAGITEHMNRDHAAALLELVAHAGAPGRAARMTGLTSAGLDVEVLSAGTGVPRHVHIPFSEPLTTPDQVRRAVMGLLGQARQARQAKR